MSKRIIDFIEAPIFEGSPSPGVELAYSAIKEELLSDNTYFKDYIQNVTVPSRTDSFGTKNITKVLTKCENVRLSVLDSVKQNHFPIIIGGDHSAAMASIAAASESYGIDNLAIIYIDGHCDINTEKTSKSHNIHGMPLASSMGLCCKDLQVGQFRKKVLGKNIFILGARSIDPPEYEIINKNGVHLYTNEQISSKQLSSILEDLKKTILGKKVHISFDVDVLDPNVLKSTGYVMPNGLSLEIVETILLFAFDLFDVVSFDIVEYNPTFDKDKKDITVVVELLKLIEKQLGNCR